MCSLPDVDSDWNNSQLMLCSCLFMHLVLLFSLQGAWQSQALRHGAVCVSLLPDNSEVPRGEAEGSDS